MTNFRSTLGKYLAAACLFFATAMSQSVVHSQANTAPDAALRGALLRIVIIGDSTVSDYPASHASRGWGQFSEDHFESGTVQVINLAKSGRSTKTFIKEGRWKEALAEKPDYVLIQFGHNDSHDPDNAESTDSATDYQNNLGHYIDGSLQIGATPILVTPMVRRTFNAQGKITESQLTRNRPLLAYVDAMKEIGDEKKVAVIDLHTSSRTLMEELGPQQSKELANKSGDATHFNEKGARAMAELVIQELPAAAPKLSDLLARQRR